MEGHLHRAFLPISADKQQKLFGDLLQGGEIHLRPAPLLRRPGGVLGQPQPQACEGAAQVMGDAAQHGGPLLAGQLEPGQHGVEVVGEVAHRSGAAGGDRQGLLVETHLLEGGIEQPQGPLHLQAEKQQQGGEPPHGPGEGEELGIGRPSPQGGDRGKHPGRFQRGGELHPHATARPEGGALAHGPHHGTGTELAAEIGPQGLGLALEGGISRPLREPGLGGLGTHRHLGAHELGEVGRAIALQGHLTEQHHGTDLTDQLAPLLMFQALGQQHMEQQQAQGGEPCSGGSIAQGPQQGQPDPSSSAWGGHRAQRHSHSPTRFARSGGGPDQAR